MLRVVSLVALTVSCLHVASPRVEKDRAVGHASSDGVRVDVTDGLAAVRAVSASRVVLWASAPALHVVVESAPRAMVVSIANVLADATAAPLSSTRPSPGRIEIALEPADFHDGRAEIFLRAPDDASPVPFRFAMYADVQEAIDSVGDVYRAMSGRGARFALCAGDLTEHGNRDELERFERELSALPMPVYATLGNHELGNGEVPYHEYYGRGSSSFVFHGTRFTLIDSASATIDPEAYDWLDGWLLAGRDQMHIVSMHVPPLDPVGTRSGSFASRNEANKLLSKLAGGRVDLTLYGHVHSYYAFSNADIPAYIAGGGGAIPERMDGIGRHFLVVDVDPARQAQTTALVRVD